MADRKPTITVLLDMEAIQRIDTVADKMGLSRTKVASNLLSAGMVFIEFGDKSGLLRLGLWLEWIIAKLKDQDSAVDEIEPEVEKTTITTHLTHEEYEFLGQVSEKFYLTRARIAAGIIISNLPALERLQKMGLVDIVNHLSSLKENALKVIQGNAKGKARANPAAE